MTAQEYYQNHPQNYATTAPPPQYQPYGSPAQRPAPWPQHSSVYPYPGTPQPQPFQQPFLAPQQNQQQMQMQQRPPMPPAIQTHQPYVQTQNQAPQVLPAHLRPTRSYSEPPSPRDYERHRRRHASHDRRRRSPSPSDSESDYSSRSRSRSRHRHRDRDIPVHPSSRKLSWADKARGKKEYVSRDNKDHTSRNTFFGAFGGGAIGDLIAPGLGTLGGALLGGFGGHEAGRSRSGSGRDGGRSRKRDKYDEEWEEGRRRRGEI